MSTLLFIFFTVVGIADLRGDWELNHTGVLSIATVGDLKSVHNPKRGEATYYYFVIVDGKTASLGFDQPVAKGYTATVTYMPQDIKRIKLGDHTNRSLTQIVFNDSGLWLLLMLFALLFLAIGSFFSLRRGKD